jgi:hypothetical protein
MAAVTLASTPALARRRVVASDGTVAPSTGTGMIVTGSIFTGIGVANLITAPICKTSAISGRDTQDVCFGVSLTIGGVFTAIGVPLLLVGIHRHNNYVEWKREHPALAALSDVSVTPTRNGGAALTWGTSF